MQSDERTITYTPSKKDLLVFNIRGLYRNRSLRVFMLFGFLFILIIEFTNPPKPAPPFLVNLIVSVLAAVAISILVVLVQLVFLFLSVRKSKFKNVLTEQTTTIAPDGLEAKSAMSEGLLKWAGIHKVDSTKTLLIIYTNETTARIIPKRFFSSPESALAFEQAIRAKMQPG